MENYAQMSLLAGKLVTVVSHSLSEVKLEESDLATAALAIKYAGQIDSGNLATLAKLGPLLLQVMESLQMSPKSRAINTKGDGTTNGTPANPKLDELRSKRLSKSSGTPDIHTASS